jgi:hypothetical protein
LLNGGEEVDGVAVVYKCHLSEKVDAVCVQTLQVQLHRAATAKTKTAPAAVLTFTNSCLPSSLSS